MERNGTSQLEKLTGRTVVDCYGYRIGEVEDVYFDETTGRAEWFVVKRGLLGLKHAVVPAVDHHQTGAVIQVPFSRDQVKDAPGLEADADLSDEFENSLYSHYRLQSPQEDEAANASEEHLGVRKVKRPRQLVRLKKYNA